MDILSIINKHALDFESDNFNDWKITEIMYIKIQHCIDILDGSDALEEHVNTLLAVQSFIEDLQKLEK